MFCWLMCNLSDTENAAASKGTFTERHPCNFTESEIPCNPILIIRMSGNNTGKQNKIFNLLAPQGSNFFSIITTDRSLEDLVNISNLEYSAVPK